MTSPGRVSTSFANNGAIDTGFWSIELPSTWLSPCGTTMTSPAFTCIALPRSCGNIAQQLPSVTRWNETTRSEGGR
jgi:hypothetical protein